MSNTIETITAEQAETMLDLMLPEFGSRQSVLRGVRNRCMMMLMLDAGLRVGEMVQLLQMDLFFNNEVVATLRVRKEIAKGKTERLVPITDRLKIAIEEMQKHIWHWKAEKSPNYAFYKLINGKLISTRQVERIIAKYSVLAFGEAIHPHTLRHAFATRLMACTNMRTVQMLLGHKNIQTTQVYTHPNNQDLKTAIKAMENGAS